MLSNGKWIAENPEENRVAGFHLSSLYSPIGWKSWADIAREFLEAHRLQKEGDHSAMETWVNTVLGETWEDIAEQVDYEILYNRCEEYGDKVPMGAAVLTAGCDVQKDRIECEVVAWGKDEESWSMEYKVLLGDPAKPDVWKEFDSFIQKNFQHESGINIRILSTCVDTGFHSKQVYDFVRERQVRGVYAIKGSNQAAVPIISERPPKRQKMSKVHLFQVGTDTAKQSIYGRIKVEEPGAGYMHFPESYEEGYFRQLTSERIVFRKGRRTWDLASGRRNEALDCRVYALAALEILKTFSDFNLNRQCDVLTARANRAKVKKEEGSTSSMQPIPKQQQSFNKRQKKGWVNSWK